MEDNIALEGKIWWCRVGGKANIDLYVGRSVLWYA